MIRKLTDVGGELGLVIEGPILELLGIDRDTELEVRTDGEGLVIRPVGSDRARRLRASAEAMMDAHDDTFRKLAECPGLLSALVFLDFNGLPISAQPKELYELTMSVARGEATKAEVTGTLRRLTGSTRRAE